MVLSGRRCGPCFVDKKCLGNNVIYFSFLMPLQHRIIHDFVRGCANGQSYFVAIEKRSKCLVWASIPSGTLLSSYCLFEVLIDTYNGGTFPGCQYVIDHLFRTFTFTNKVTLNRIPYAIKRRSAKKTRINFISSLKKIFKTNSFCDLKDSNREKFHILRGEENFELRDTLFAEENLTHGPKYLVNYKGPRPRCSPESIKEIKKLENDFKSVFKHIKHDKGLPSSKIAKSKLKNNLKNMELDSHILKENVSLEKTTSEKYSEGKTESEREELDNSRNVIQSKETREKITNEILTEKDICQPINFVESTTGTGPTSISSEHKEDQISAFNLLGYEKTNAYQRKEMIAEVDEGNRIEIVHSITSKREIKLSTLYTTDDRLVKTNETGASDILSKETYQTINNFPSPIIPPSSSLSIHCTSTSNTEQLMSPLMIASMEELEVRDQVWTPVPLSSLPQSHCTTNKSNICSDPDLNILLLDWENRLRITIKKYLLDNIF